MIKGESETRTYPFRVVVEPDEDRWHTREEALKNMREVVGMIVEELIEDGEYIPEALEKEVRIFSEPRVMVTA